MTDGAGPAPGAQREASDALAALERLVSRHKLLTPEQALQAARIITGDPTFEFPPPRPAAPPPPAPPPPAPAAPPADEPPAPAQDAAAAEPPP
jgi:hypothetical protein